MVDEQILSKAGVRFRQEGRLIYLPEGRPIVFVGDTHGDREATERVFSRFLGSDHVIVFLGDYVDRGPDSRGNLELLLRTKLAHPDQVILLMGNHEGWAVTPFSPADFWQRLPSQVEQTAAKTLSLLPFAAAHPAGLLALHGALPDVETIDAIKQIRLGSADWHRITWGDWIDRPGQVIDPGAFGRPTFGRDAFKTIADRLRLHVLVRSHQPFAPTFQFDDRCLTIFTSTAYGGRKRQVAILKPGKSLQSARDLELLSL